MGKALAILVATVLACGNVATAGACEAMEARQLDLHAGE
jgi:hypothetical protein